MPPLNHAVNQWLPFGFALILWLSMSPAMAMIWILSFGLGLIPKNGQEEAMIAIAMLALVRRMFIVSFADTTRD